MKTLNEAKEAIRPHRQELEDRFKVKQMGIFGSYVRDEQGGKSDMDILTEFKEPIGLFKFMDLEDYIGKLLGTRVDMVSKKALKPHIGKRILKEVEYIW